MQKEQLTLALLTNIEFIEEYITVFKKSRADNKFNTGHIRFISEISALLRKDSGYLYQNHTFLKKIDTNMTIQEWRKLCLNTRNRLLQIGQFLEEARKNGSYDFELGRDPVEPIKEILELKEPLSVTIKMVKDILADIEKCHTKPIVQAIRYRDALLLTMLQACPLRVGMFSKMTINQNLVKKSDGAWWVQFNRKSFKNRNQLKTNYSVKIPKDVGTMIDRYLTEFRPILLNSKNSNFVFLAASHNPLTKPNLRLTARQISRNVLTYTKKYIPNCPGFGAHAFRHIVATSIIKNNPATGFYLAAKVLNDKIETVEKAYAHLKTSELLEPYSDFFEETWKYSTSENSAH